MATVIEIEMSSNDQNCYIYLKL